MGWLFGWNTRKELADHLISGNGVHTLKHCFKGNNLWAVQEYTYPARTYDDKPHPKAGQTTRFIALYLIKGRDKCNPRTGKYDSHGWGYKDMDETAGPYYYNCPLSYLDMVPDPMTTHSTPWRVLVREYWAKRNRKLVEGQRIKLYGKEYTVGAVRNGKQRVWDYDVEYTLPKRMLKDVEVLA